MDLVVRVPGFDPAVVSGQGGGGGGGGGGGVRQALTQMSHYAKFMKDILSIKRKIAKKGIVSLTATCNALI